MKKYNVSDKKGNVLLTFITYDKKIEKVIVKQFQKIKQVNVYEVKQ